MEQAPSHDTTLHGVRVLLVEDEFLILMELESVLLEAGAEIAASCRTVQDALAAADEPGLTVALLDVRLGTESSRPVAQHLTSRGIPFLFYTGEVEAVRREWPQCKIVSKPADRGAIVSAIIELGAES